MNLYESRDQRPAWLSAELQQEVREREQRLTRLSRRLRAADAEYSSLHTASGVDLRQVRQCLSENEVMIEYFLVEGQVSVFVIRREGVEVVPNLTTTEAMSLLLRRLRFYFSKFTLSEQYVRSHRDRIDAATRQCLEKLYDGLIRPVEPLLGGQEVIVVPHGFLHYVPFHALPDGRQYLMDRHEVSYCPSASAYKLCVDKSRTQRRDGRVLIVGVPDEAAPFVRKEVALVESLWGDADVLLAEEATLEAVKHRAPQCRLLHLASHGVFRRDNPMFSALTLGDAWLNFYDSFNLNLPASLVTLSAGETGMNQVFPGDELLGLMRGFLYAGAPSLIVSLWVVSDRSTAEFMGWFDQGLRDGLSKRAALRQAQVRLKQEYHHPCDWAPFILIGAPA
jgi:CHAT domain-containing protein